MDIYVARKIKNIFLYMTMIMNLYWKILVKKTFASKYTTKIATIGKKKYKQ